MIFELDTRLIRVQCKWAPRQGEVIVLRCYSCRRNRDGLLRRIYTDGEIDAFAAYCQALVVATSFLLSSFVIAHRSPFEWVRARTTRGRGSAGRAISSSPLHCPDFWGHSSAGRASAWHAEGRRFEPGWLHLRQMPGRAAPLLGCDVRDRLGERPPVPGQILGRVLPLPVGVIGRGVQDPRAALAGMLVVSVRVLDAHHHGCGRGCRTLGHGHRAVADGKLGAMVPGSPALDEAERLA